jgi:hypothetical protein
MVVAVQRHRKAIATSSSPSSASRHKNHRGVVLGGGVRVMTPAPGTAVFGKYVFLLG